jgi:hypothetical protein
MNLYGLELLPVWLLIIEGGVFISVVLMLRRLQKNESQKKEGEA